MRYLPVFIFFLSTSIFGQEHKWPVMKHYEGKFIERIAMPVDGRRIPRASSSAGCQCGRSQPAFDLHPTSDPEFVFRVLGGRIDRLSEWRAVILPDGRVTCTPGSGMEEIDVAIIGAGVTGLACGHFIAARRLSVCVLERHARPGIETSTHNSGVIHAGIYYPAGALKTRLCVEGRPLLYEFCRLNGIPHARCGKLIVATDEAEAERLEPLRACGVANGVEGLEIVDRSFIAQREPAVSAVAALFSPESGIVEAEGLVRALLNAARAAGAIFLPGTPIVGGEAEPGRILVRTPSETIAARQVVNAAGLYADDVSRLLGGEHFTIYPCRGEYAELAPSQTLAHQRTRLPAAPAVRTRAWRAPEAGPGRERLDRTDGVLPGQEGRL